MTDFERPSMIHIKVDVRIWSHPKFCSVGFEGIGLWTVMTAFTRDHLLDGRIPKSSLGRLGGNARQRLRVVQKLIDAELIEDRIDHYFVLKYVEKGNQTKAEIDEKRAESRERMRSVRANRKSEHPPPFNEQPDLSQGEVRSSPSVNADPLSNGEGEVTAATDPHPSGPMSVGSPVAAGDRARDNFGDHETGTAWIAGRVRGGAVAVTRPRGAEVTKLRDAAEAHCPSPQLGERCRWLDAKAEAFERAAGGRKRNAWAFADWLDNGCAFPVTGTRAAPKQANPVNAPWLHDDHGVVTAPEPGKTGT